MKSRHDELLKNQEDIIKERDEIACDAETAKQEVQDLTNKLEANEKLLQEQFASNENLNSKMKIQKMKALARIKEERQSLNKAQDKIKELESKLVESSSNDEVDGIKSKCS